VLNKTQSKYLTKRNIIGLENNRFTGNLVGDQNTLPATDLKQITCQFVTLSNYNLNGTQTVDGISPLGGDLILVANQTDKSENGVYTYNSSSDWNRQTGIQGGQLITITGGLTKEGTLWVVETTTFTEGTDNIDIVEQSLTRKAGDFAGFSTFSLTTSDILLAEDVSNSNAKGKVTVNDIVSLAGQDSQLDTTEYTFFVSPNFTQTGQFYNNLEDALDDANLTANVYTIIVFKGTYTGNFDVQGQMIYCMPEVEIKTTNKAFPVIEVGTNGKWLGHAQIIDNPTSGYAVELDDNTEFEFHTCVEDSNAIKVVAIASGDVYIRGNRVGKVYTASHELKTYIDVETISEVEWSDIGECYVECKEFETVATVTAGTVRINAERYLAEDTRIFDVTNGTLIASGRAEDFNEAQDTSTGAGFPILQVSGTIQLNNFFAHNDQGGIVFGSGGTLKTANTTLEAGTAGGGGTADTIYSPVFGAYTVLYNNSTSLNSNPHVNVSELVTANRVQNALITI
jgi:hypothetical protein